jgi:hypothetical protein
MKSIAALFLALTLATPAVAQDRILVDTSAGEQVDEALERVLGALWYVMRAIPQYELPEVLPNGDILIRRIPQEPEPEAEPEKKPAPEADHTQT